MNKKQAHNTARTKHSESVEQSHWYEGFADKNTVLAGGLVIAPVVVVANSLQNALQYSLVFTVVTFLTILIASFVPRSIVYTIRIILYVIIAALVYAPTAIMMDFQANILLRIYMPLIIANGLIVSKAETRFFKLSKGQMLRELIAHIAGFDVVMLFVATIRELFGNGTFLGNQVYSIWRIPVLSEPFGGFILLGLLCAAYRVLLEIIQKQAGKES